MIGDATSFHRDSLLFNAWVRLKSWPSFPCHRWILLSAIGVQAHKQSSEQQGHHQAKTAHGPAFQDALSEGW